MNTVTDTYETYIRTYFSSSETSDYPRTQPEPVATIHQVGFSTQQQISLSSFNWILFFGSSL